MHGVNPPFDQIRLIFELYEMILKETSTTPFTENPIIAETVNKFHHSR
jgi:hypothetical protein